MAGRTDWWAHPRELTEEIARYSIATAEIELERLDRDCHRSLSLTPVARWTHLQVIYIAPGPRTHGERIPPAVACSWPDPVPREER